MPWVIINFKSDDLIDALPATQLHGFKLPKLEPGLYRIKPRVDDWDGVEHMLNTILERTHIGVFVDELLPMSSPRHPAYRYMLTQGRSLHCPIIGCTQRPVDIDRYAFSESEFLSVLQLQDDREAEKVKDFTGKLTTANGEPFDIVRENDRLAEFHSIYIDRKKRKAYKIGPAPDADTIIEKFEQRLRSSAKSQLF